MSYTSDLDNEEHPRNAAAIRTAILLGAVFEQDSLGYWSIRDWSVRGAATYKSKLKTMPAWLFLCTHGLGIDHDGVPRPFCEIVEDDTPHDTWRRIGLRMENKDVNEQT